MGSFLRQSNKIYSFYLKHHTLMKLCVPRIFTRVANSTKGWK